MYPAERCTVHRPLAPIQRRDRAHTFDLEPESDLRAPTAEQDVAIDVCAALALGLQVSGAGSQLEGAGFWDGVDVVTLDGHWLDGAACVVQPSVIEDQPRKLLAALAAGVPVIATEACGIEPRAGLTLVPEGDADALIAAIQAITEPVREVA